MSTTAVAQFDVTVIYNGVARTVTVNAKQAVQAVLQHALNQFGVHQNRENFGLFNTEGQELPTNHSVESAGVAGGDQLLLRPLRVSGGG